MAKETGKGAKKGGGRLAQKKKQLEWKHRGASRGPLAVSKSGTKQGRHIRIAEKNKEKNIRIAALNGNGITQPHKVLALGRYLAGLEPRPIFCILTETHLYEWEVKRIRKDTYVTSHQSCRRNEDGNRHVGAYLF